MLWRKEHMSERQIPAVGRVAAGMPILALENIEEKGRIYTKDFIEENLKDLLTFARMPRAEARG